MEPRKNHNRLEQITHYVIARTPSEQLGATKLNKVLWLIDLLAWRERAESLTGVEAYRRLPFGPVPTAVKRIVDDLVQAGSVVERRTVTPVGDRRELISIHDPDLAGLTASDVDLIHRAIDFIRPLSAQQVSEYTHDVYWEEVPENGLMSVGAACLWPGTVDEAAMDWAMDELKAQGIR